MKNKPFIKQMCRAGLCLFCVLLLHAQTALAQNEITGIVNDETGEPLIGVNIMVRGTTVGTITDLNGHFSLKASNGAVLIFKYIGYKDVVIPIKGQNVLKVTMNSDSQELGEVFVVGYGTMKKTDLTGAATQLKTDAITASVAANPLASLQGKSSGVAVFTNSQPGASPTVRVRGTGSISASNAPLYVVDGFPLMDGNLNDINPADIESMEVLKDASSTAIYGSRGANGVIMITTKKGTKGTKNLSINASTGIQIRSRLVKTITGQDFLDYMSQINNNTITNTSNRWTDWQKESTNSTALTQNYSITFDGNNNGTNYMLSAGYYNQDGIVDKQGFEKISIHNNLQHKYNSWLTVGSSMQVTTSTQHTNNNALGDVFRYGWPTEPVYHEDGTYNIAATDNPYIAIPFNSVADIAATTDKTENLRFLGNFFAEVAFNKHLSYKLSVGYDVKNSRNYYYTSSQTASAIFKGVDTGTGGHTWNKNYSKLMDNIITYKNEWGNHRLTATGVYSYQDYKYEDIDAESNVFDNDLLGAWSIGGKTLSDYGSNIYSNKLISFTGRISYAYKDKYLFTGTARYDGSSRFGENNKWGLFPSVGLAWRATQEKFLKNNSIITDLKIRGSFGITGNQEIGNYKSLAQLSSGTSNSYANGTNTLVGYAESVGNPSLKWERTAQTDLGFDLSLWNRLNINFDYYIRTTKDLLYNVPIPSSSGYSTVLSNVGEVSNKGLEITMGSNIYKNKNWSIDASVNFTYNNNEIKKLYGEVNQVNVNVKGSSGIGQILKIGYPVNSVWARKSLGIIKTQEQLDAYRKLVPTTGASANLGDEMYADIDDNGTVDSNDYICLGSVEPKYFYGLNLGIQYKQFKMNIYGQGAFKYASISGQEETIAGNSSLNMGYSNVSSYLIYADNQAINTNYIPSQKAYNDMWSTSNQNGNHPRVGAYNVYLSDRTNGNWYYFILKNIQLSYDCTSLINIKTVKKLTVNVNLQNFLTSSKTNGYNPENGDISNPWAKIIMFGLSAKF